MATVHNAVELSGAEGGSPTDLDRRSLKRTLRRVAVLGAGTMGARMAAHFANAGLPVACC